MVHHQRRLGIVSEVPDIERASGSPRAPFVGFLDSGIGGLTVWREAVRLLPSLSTHYLADNLHCPYGSRPAAELRRIVVDAVDGLLGTGCTAIVLACNTATAAAVATVRRLHPAIPVVGMEPAVKPAAAQTRTGVVGVLATGGTLRGRLFHDTSERYAGNVRLAVQDAGDLVPFIERGDTDSDDLRTALGRHLTPILDAGADCVVLGCTHFPFLIPTIREMAGPSVTLVDPAPAVARQLARRIGPLASGGAPARRTFATTGSPVDFAAFLRRLDAPGAH